MKRRMTTILMETSGGEERKEGRTRKAWLRSVSFA